MKVLPFGLTLLLFTLAGIAAEPAPSAPAKLMDETKAGKVSVVLRVELLKAATAVEKYGYDQVRVLQVYKNEPGVKLPNELTIAFRNTDTGVPPGVSTVYLVDYRNPPDGKLWRVEDKSHLEKK